jgi:hypothetical protein
MKDTPRSKPYIWTTWLAGYLGGDKCKWKTWYKSHFRYDKLVDPERESFLAEWTKAHDKMAQDYLSQEREYEDLEWDLVEDEAKFTIKGKAADLSGKPDLVLKYKSQETPIICDFKTGIQRDSDFAQVRIYQFALPRSGVLSLPCTVSQPRGRLVYRSGTVEVEYYVDQEHLIVEAIKEIGSDKIPDRVPSTKECSRCDVLNCPDRMGSNEKTTDEF